MASVWKNQELEEYVTLSGDIKTDVLIIGGGMAGLLCAWELNNAGVSCIVAEATTIGQGITKDTTAKITAQHGLIYQELIRRFGVETAKLYLQANLDAVCTYRRICGDMDCDFQQKDNYIYSRSDRKKLDQELEALHQIGYCADIVEKLPLPFPTVGAVRFANQAQFHPLKFLKCISQDLTIYENTPITQLVPGGADTPRGHISARKIIVATHFPFLNKHGSYFLKLYQQRSYVLALEGADCVDGMYLDEAKNGLSFRMYQDRLFLGGGGHRTGKQGGGWRELEAFAHAHYPGADITNRWATQDCMSLDGIPYIGQYSKRTPELLVATGFNKWGMTSAMVSAMVLRDLILEKDTPYATVFSPSRSILHPQLAINSLESVSNLLSFSSKRCPHMGCALKWNPQEHSWDCPCHGSRFAENGKRLDNPATQDLDGV